ncbi:MAG: NADH-quinone oxidoreductase subunit C [Actinomycetota bacterium]
MPADTQTRAQILDDVSAEIRAHLGDKALDISENHGNLIVRVASENRVGALSTLKVLGFAYYSWAGGVDWPADNRFEVLDHVSNPTRNVQLTLKCEVPRDNPRVPTAVDVYPGADWHERETWELFGIVFVDHPRLRRLLLADWQEGFPMRKDEVLRARVEKPWPGDFFSG